MISYKESKEISDKDLRALYDALDWVSYTEQLLDLQALLTNCQLVYSAWDGEKLVGLVRTVGDGISIQYVQDILILPDYQKSGIGKQLLAYVLEKSKDIRQVVLMTDTSPENQYVLDWYKKQGLTSFQESGLEGFWKMA